MTHGPKLAGLRGNTQWFSPERQDRSVNKCWKRSQKAGKVVDLRKDQTCFIALQQIKKTGNNSLIF